MTKLSNEEFLQKAPESVIDKEKKKLEELEKIKERNGKIH